MYYRLKSSDMVAFMSATRGKASNVFGKRFKKAREDALLSQSDVTGQLEKAGISLTQSGLSHYETGRTFPDPATLVAMADVVGVSLDYLLGRTETPSPVAEIEEALAAATGKGRINRIVGQLNKDRQQQVLDFAEFLLSQEKKTVEPDELSQWVASTEVLLRRFGTSGERSFVKLLSTVRPDLASTLGILPKEELA